MKSQAPYTVVVGFDFSRPAHLALSQALELAEHYHPATIHVLGALDPGQENATYQGADKMRKAIEEAIGPDLSSREITDTKLFVHARIGKAANEILGLANEVEADMICVGSHGLHGLPRWVLGSVSERVLRGADCPVLAARPKAYDHDNQPAAPRPEPPCRDCAMARAESDGATWWCKIHNDTHAAPTRYVYRTVPRQGAIRHAVARPEAPLGPKPAADDKLAVASEQTP